MINFKHYLMESEKKYGFRAKLAAELNKEQMESLQKHLARWNLEAISEPKRLPVAEEHQGFSHIKNTELYIVDMVVNYPCTPQEIQNAIHEATKVPMSHIMVLTPEQEVIAAPIAPESDQPILTSDYPEQKAPQLLADLANALKAKGIDQQFATKQMGKAKTSNDLPQGTSSPIGTLKNKLPFPKAGRK
jgi:hypothetical protein